MLINLKKHYPNSPCPTTSTVYKCLKSNEFSLSIDILQFLSVGKYRKRTLKTQKSSLKKCNSNSSKTWGS
ncbi:hypothetical protein [Mycoplasmopsis anatis]|uniref:hypothetical protein n=1 Tax=Mycoplasmopsis anatis TaxID=171279 RepID=UPI003F86A723